MKESKSGEALFFELAIEDLQWAADLFRPIHDRTNGVDGWVSLEVSPLLARITAGTPRCGQGSPCPRGTSQSLHQDPRYCSMRTRSSNEMQRGLRQLDGMCFCSHRCGHRYQLTGRKIHRRAIGTSARQGACFTLKRDNYRFSGCLCWPQ